jgi:competence protein ComGC
MDKQRDPEQKVVTICVICIVLFVVSLLLLAYLQ